MLTGLTLAMYKTNIDRSQIPCNIHVTLRTSKKPKSSSIPKIKCHQY